jgi:KUP system potassium uptake protein
LRVDFIDALLLRQIPRNPGTAVFVSPLGGVDAPSFVRYLARTKRLAKQVLFATLKVELVPHVPCNEQASFVDRGDGVLMATIRFGYCDEPDIPRALTSAAALRWDPATTRYCITREPG